VTGSSSQSLRAFCELLWL